MWFPVFFNEVLTQAERSNWLSQEHFSVDDTLIRAKASHKSFVAKDSGGVSTDGGDGGNGGNFRGQRLSNDTHASKSDPDSWLYRKGLITNARVTQADGYAEREATKAMVNDARQANAEAAIPLGADKGYDAAGRDG
jgi:hypothetical protein